MNPDRYPDLRDWSKAAVHEFLAKQHKVGVRSVYRWHTAFRTGGLPALVAKDRCDKGKPKKFGQADLELITRAALPEKGTSGLLTVADIYRHHTEEREWRDDHVGKRLDSFARAKYARYIDEDGKLRESARLTKATYETFRVWFNRIPEAVKLLARDGEEAFRNQAEMLSHRAYDMQPLDYLVMDHRRLDVFCLFPARGGWKLARPWLTAAIDMRTRKWLGWVIVETPSSDSIAAVLKQVFMRWGLPRECYWDNGKDFRCQWFEGREERSVDGKTGELGTAWRGVMETLGIRVRPRDRVQRARQDDRAEFRSHLGFRSHAAGVVRTPAGCAAGGVRVACAPARSVGCGRTRRDTVSHSKRDRRAVRQGDRGSEREAGAGRGDEQDHPPGARLDVSQRGLGKADRPRGVAAAAARRAAVLLRENQTAHGPQ